MGFTEITFLFVFLPASVVLYLIVDRVFHRAVLGNWLLIGMSFLFLYWANKEAMVFMLFVGFFIYAAGEALKNQAAERQRGQKKRAVLLPVLCLVGILVFYKYVSFIAPWINRLLNKELISAGKLIVPIGLSFMIFESISYLIDIYRGDAEAGSLVECFTFISLFPKLVSGPIVLWKDFKPLLSARRSTGEQISAGIDRIIIGYAKKVIIADTFGAQIALINSNIALGVDVPTMWLRALLYFFQLYFDFSGYSDIALGLCSIFGFTIKENFNYPYLSKSITEFWRRWHISLGSWFREYVYIPLGGNRKGNVYVHLLVVFILTGLWHGTGLHFLVWGLFHGVVILLERFLASKAWYQRIPAALKWLFTVICVFFAWVLFMSENLAAALQTYANMFVPMTNDAVNFTWLYYLSNRTMLFLGIAVAGHIFGIEKLRARTQRILDTAAGSLVKRAVLLLLFAVDILYVVNSTYSPFLYFQF